METVLFEKMKEGIIHALESKLPNLECPLCAGKELTLVDGFFNRTVNDSISSALRIGGPVIPTVGLVCIGCGHLSEFSLGALGLLPKSEEKK